MEDGALQSDNPKPIIKVGNKPGFHNQANIKAAARGIILEALTAFKGGKVGKRGLLVRAMANLEQALSSDSAVVREWATEQTLKLAMTIAKDDKSGNALEDLLKGATNVQINFNSHFSQRSGIDRQELPAQSLTVGFTPPPESGDRPLSSG